MIGVKGAAMGEKLVLDGVDKSFFWEGADVEVLKNFSLYVNDFEFVSLLGPSGCGKSTVLKLISGLIQPDRGSITYSPHLKKVSFMPQDDLLLPWRTVMENACIPLEIAGVSKKEAKHRAGKLLDLFGLAGFENSYPSQLSGGMRQRVAVMRTFLHQGDIFLLDEPFGRLDALTRLKMQMWLLKVWQEFRQSVLFVTHDIEEAIFLSDRIYLMTERPGTVKEEVYVNLPRPRGEEILTSPEFVAQKKLILSML
jgi:ABC-type nitrate/sulfonate/bicarbonate transport system ATPase subunit